MIPMFLILCYYFLSYTYNRFAVSDLTSRYTCDFAVVANLIMVR